MAYTVGQLLFDVLPRVGNTRPTGITLIGAANSITNLIYKKLLERRSDILATGQLAYILPANGYTLTLPSDFISMAEKPHSKEVPDLITNLTVELGLAGLSVPNAALVAAMLAVGTGVAIADIQTIVGNVATVQTIVNALLTTSRNRHLEPSYLGEDDHDERSWWDWYGTGSDEAIYHHAHTHKIINSSMFMRPKTINDVTIGGRYFQIPAKATTPADSIPFAGMFDELYREGVVNILLSGVAMPDIDPAFAAFIHREISTVLDARVQPVKRDGRVSRRNWI